jgi:hypothetical protein
VSSRVVAELPAAKSPTLGFDTEEEEEEEEEKKGKIKPACDFEVSKSRLGSSVGATRP